MQCIYPDQGMDLYIECIINALLRLCVLCSRSPSLTKSSQLLFFPNNGYVPVNWTIKNMCHMSHFYGWRPVPNNFNHVMDPRLPNVGFSLLSFIKYPKIRFFVSLINAVESIYTKFAKLATRPGSHMKAPDFFLLVSNGH